MSGAEIGQAQAAALAIEQAERGLADLMAGLATLRGLSASIHWQVDTAAAGWLVRRITDDANAIAAHLGNARHALRQGGVEART